MTDTNGNGRVQQAADSTLAKAIARFGVPLLLTIIGWGVMTAWQEQRAINAQVADNARSLAVHEIRLDEHDRRLGYLESRRAMGDRPPTEARR